MGRQQTAKDLKVLKKQCSLLLQLFSQFWHSIEKVAYKTNISNLKDWRIDILVDRRYDLAVLHACKMLYGSRNTSAEVELRRNVLASLSDLQAVVRKATIDRCS